jgi:hypothetical protein
LIVDLYVDRVCPTDAHLPIAGSLWYCTAILPGGDCETMDMPQGSTYAQAARQVNTLAPSSPGDGELGGEGIYRRQQTKEEFVSAKKPKHHTQKSVVVNYASWYAMPEENASVDSHTALPPQDCHLGGCGA